MPKQNPNSTARGFQGVLASAPAGRRAPDQIVIDDGVRMESARWPSTPPHHHAVPAGGIEESCHLILAAVLPCGVHSGHA
jgi:hypothetical protein